MRVSAQLDTLFNQAQISVAEYFDAACDIVEQRFGSDFGSTHSQLVGQLVNAMAFDLATTMFAKAVGELNDSIGAIAFSIR